MQDTRSLLELIKRLLGNAILYNDTSECPNVYIVLYVSTYKRLIFGIP